MWEAIQYVGTPLTLIAFLASIIAYIYSIKTFKQKNLIDSAPESDRASLVEGALRDFKVVDTASLTKAQKHEIVIKLLDHRHQRFKVFLYFSSGAFFLLFILIVVYLFQSRQVQPESFSWEYIDTYRGLKIQKPLNWYLVNDGESPTFSIENPSDDSVYVTISPMSLDEYENNDNQNESKLTCEFLRNISAGSAGPESDGVAILKKCSYLFENDNYEELVLYVNGARFHIAVRCGYKFNMRNQYSSVCNTIVGTARYRQESDD